MAIVGKVVAVHDEKTVVVERERLKMHIRYKKQIKVRTKLKARDEQGLKPKIGMFVTLTSIAPKSKTVNWLVTKLHNKDN